MRAILSAALVCTGLVGCATTSRFQADLVGWVGRPIGDYVVASVIPPTQVIDDGKGGKVYVFDRRRGATCTPSADQPATAGAGAASGATTSGGASTRVDRDCIWTLETNAAGVIERWSYRGSACRS